MKSVGKEGLQPGGKNKPYAGPMYSSGTKDLDVSNQMGKVEGPKTGKSVPDPLGYIRKGEAK
jgi:hypothetical protein